VFHTINLLGYLEVVFSIAGLCALSKRKLWREYWSIGAYLSLHAFAGAAMLPLYSQLHSSPFLYNLIFSEAPSHRINRVFVT
jgi:hypothetical protein